MLNEKVRHQAGLLFLSGLSLSGLSRSSAKNNVTRMGDIRRGFDVDTNKLYDQNPFFADLTLPEATSCV
jgi:hypothetical protein